MNPNPLPSWNPFRRHVSVVDVEEPLFHAHSTTKATKSNPTKTTVSSVKSWPEEAQPLKQRNWVTRIYAIGDVILVLLPIFFIHLGIAVIKLNGKPTKDSAFGKKVEFAMDLSPTIFPIVFAAIIGRSMKMVARYLAEKGTRITTLELLMASQSVWGTVESQFLMQKLTLVGVNLLFLWALSPLGGQASLRLMKRDTRGTHASAKLRYMTSGPAATAWGLTSTYSDSGKFADAGALYTSALMAPLATKLGPQDPWGNVKIPILDGFKSSLADLDGWYTVTPNLPTPEAYSSLVGLPIVGLPSNAESSFNLQYTYLSVDCGSFKQSPYPGNNGSTNFLNTNGTKLEELVPGQVWFDKPTDDPFGYAGSNRTSFFIDTTRSFPRGMKEGDDHDIYTGRLDGFFGNYNLSLMPEAELSTNRELWYVSQYSMQSDDSKMGLNIAKCSLSQKHVEARIKCQSSECSTVKVRKSQEDNRASALTGFEHGTIMSSFAKKFPHAVTFNIGSSPTEHFLANTSTFPFVQQVGHMSSSTAFADLSLVPADIFSRRLGLAINTFYQLSVQPTGYFGGLPNNLSAYGPDTTPVFDMTAYLPANLSATEHTFLDWYYTFDIGIQNVKSPFIGATTTANVTTSEEIFACNFAWLTLLLVSSSITLVIGSVALILKGKTLGPEMFGFVSSMTYENPWVNAPKGGTTLDAMERARLLSNMEVRVGDVRGDDQVGHIALAAGVPLRKLERGRLYS